MMQVYRGILQPYGSAAGTYPYLCPACMEYQEVKFTMTIHDTHQGTKSSHLPCCSGTVL